jgi:hypothetical protein
VKAASDNNFIDLHTGYHVAMEISAGGDEQGKHGSENTNLDFRRIRYN